MSSGEIVAQYPSKWGGVCRDCRRDIRKGELVFKVSVEGPTTRHGQGPGKWVCQMCAGSYQDSR